MVHVDELVNAVQCLLVDGRRAVFGRKEDTEVAYAAAIQQFKEFCDQHGLGVDFSDKS